MTDQPRRDRLEMHLLATAGVVRRAYDERLASVGLNLTESGLLQFLHIDGPMSQAELAARLHIGKMSAGATVKGLLARGLVQRSPNPEDRRAWLIGLTEDGGRAVDACIAIDRVVVAQLRAGLTRADQRALHESLAAIHRNATTSESS